MLNRRFLLLLGFTLILAVVQSVLATTANSSNYSVGMFGTGMVTATPSSANYEAESLSIAQSGTRNAESNSYTVNLGFFENTTYYRTVSISSYSISPISAVVGSTIGLYISALNSQKVWAKITSPNNQEQTLNLINGQIVNYVPSPLVVGSYQVIFYANSSTGAVASVVDYFTLTEQTVTPPTQPPSGGGGSTTTIIEKSCNYNWDCTPWSLCSDGKQKRECKNIGTCEGNESKPIEEVQCSEALFDVIITFKEVTLTKNETLKFNVNLIETKGIEKIDVHIKYSILDKNNNEIFSQIETKAIQGNLSYEKELGEARLKDGVYTLRVDILYGNLQRAFAEQKFTVKNGEITIEEFIAKIQKTNIFILFCIVIIFSAIIILFVKFNGIRKSLDRVLENKGKYAVYVLLSGLIVSFLILIPKTNITGRITREVINNMSSYIFKVMLKLLIIISVFILLFIIKRRILKEKKFKTIPLESKLKSIKALETEKEKYLEIKPKKIGQEKYLEIRTKSETVEETKDKANLLQELKFFLASLFRIFKKHPSNSISGLIGKKVYSESGQYVGKVKDVILGENRIDSLKIDLNKGYDLKSKGILINYNRVVGVSEIVIIQERVFEYLESL